MELCTMHGNDSQRGFAYLVVLFIAVALGFASTITYENLSTLAKREREAQWLFAGQQYKQAITSYYHQSPNGLKSLPTKLDDLVKDSRFVSVKRHLRQLYVDPITQDVWQLLLNDQQQIVGVVSASTEPILQQATIVQLQPNAENVMTYAELKFMFEANAGQAATSAETQNSAAETEFEPSSQPETNAESQLDEIEPIDESSGF